MIIRQARLEDLHWIYSLNKVIFHEDSWSYNSYKKCLEGDKYVFLVAEEKDPCGFVLGRVIKEEAEVMKIGVSPKFQRRHIGWLLLMKLLEEFKERKVKEVFLEVRESNFPAIKLYYKLGFKEIGRRKGYYKGEDALIMKLTLAKI